VTAQIVVVAKTPVPGRVKTRLCPPCTPAEAARIAAAALADTLDTVAAGPARRRVLAVDGGLPAPGGWTRLAQRGTGLGARLANAFADAGPASLLIGMDTPQVTTAHLAEGSARLGRSDAVLGLAPDGGWWALGLGDPRHAEVLRDVPMSTARTGALTLEALRGRGLRVALLPELRDVDTAADARAVAALCPSGSRFGRAVTDLLGCAA
jgi:rSAM/selenodomain-associated transferase 1